jgi:AcrR family transcriptional regulator
MAAKASSARRHPAGRGRGRPGIDSEFDTREALLRATHDLLLERGGLRVSLNEICERAGINVAMVHYHFGSKQGLLAMLFERMCASWSAELEHLLQQDMTPTRKLELHVAQIIRNYRRAPYTTRLMAEVVSLSTTASARRLSNYFMKPLTDFYRQLIAEGVAAGEFRQVDPEFFFFSVVGACEFFFSAKRLLEAVSRHHAVNEQVEADFGRHTASLLLHGMVGPAPMRVAAIPRRRSKAAQARASA